MADLSQFDSTEAQEAGFDVVIVNPKTGEDTDIVIKVAGPESSRQKRFRAMLMNDRLNKNRNRRITAGELDQDAIKLSAASIISWKNVQENGKDIELTPENAERILAAYPIIRDQVDAAVNDRTLFMKS